MVRRSFNDDASRSDEPPPPPSSNCCAYGCPVSAGIIQEGKRYCCVHFGVRDYNDYAAATQEIRKHLKLVEAIALLRSPGSRLDAHTISDALDLWPGLTPNPKSPYAMLIEAETLLRQACLTGSNAVYGSKTDLTVKGMLRKATEDMRMPI